MDLLGNILNGNAVFNNRNQLTENAEHFFEYDLNGNLSKKTAKLSPKVIEYDFDLENRLKQVRIFDNGTTLSTRLSYKYDAFGRRIERKVEGVQTKITQFVHDGQDVLLEQNQTGQLERTYIRGSGIDELYGVIEDLNQSGTLSASEAFFFRTDHLGSVREVVRSDGLTRQSYVYSSYGVPTTTVAPGNSELKVNRLYTGREYEPETGDYYYRARYYNSSAGRFLSEDPIGFKSSDTNNYRYVFNNPSRYTDPSGKIIPIFGIIVIGIIAILPGELDDDDVTSDREISPEYERWKLDESMRKEQEKFRDINPYDDKNPQPRKEDPGQCYKS